ncbi:MAG: hypothetical protein KGM24_12850, partial [Elusimicrobia bacterium]|nr:hypothetical protein [Elusimicrobiota bacterium]
GDDAAEALLLAHDWRLPGDARTLAGRLGPGQDLPGARPSWTAARTGERSYRVAFRPGAGRPDYEFDVDLDARLVEPTPDTARLLAPRLLVAR